MTAGHAAARELFLAAIDVPPVEREAFVRTRCEGDAALFAEVRSLLAFHEDDAADSVAPVPLQVGERYAERYRILRWLGRGGMGDVYQAHDEVLDEPVALKRLLGRDEAQQEALLNEVRLARRVSHPRICRVHDVGEWRGERFITMQFIDGEDLGKLLRRVGRLPSERVAAMARELCVGLAAAHGRGVIHRDLKPANILVDVDGHVHITDFGIAARAGGQGAAAMTGTPSYMAPEQLVPGESSTERSDLYALGLVLHEMLTGEPVFTGAGLTDVLVARRDIVPRAPSEMVSDVTPELDRAVRRALRADPRERPASALDFAALLPGGDALRAAIDANTTPSPDLLARASTSITPATRLPPIAALLALVVVLAGTFVLAHTLAPFPIAAGATHPAVNVHRAVELSRQLGYEARNGGRAFHGYLPDPTAPADDPSLLFWYREDRDPLRTSFQRSVLDPTAELTLYAPTIGLPPDRIISVFDAAGQLVYFQGAAGDLRTGATPAAPDWHALLTAVGLGGARLRPAVPELPPLFATDRAAWMTLGPGDQAGARRVDAAAIDGRLVYFALGRDTSVSGPRLEARAEAESGLFVILVLVPAFFVAGIVLLVRNVRARRFDGSGTLKLVGAVAVLTVAQWLLVADHIQHPLTDYAAALGSSLRRAPSLALGAALFYLALEPTVRHAWPHTLLAWTRVLHRDGRNAIVGQSLLVGALAGALCGLIYVADQAVPQVFTTLEPQSVDFGPRLLAALGVRETASLLLGNAAGALARGVMVLFVFTTLRSWLRRPAIAAVVFVLLVAALEGAVGVHHDYSIVTMGVPIGIVTAWVLARAGLLAYVASAFAYTSLRFAPMTLDFGAWWAWSGVTAAGAVLLMGGIGAWMCRGRPASRGDGPFPIRDVASA